MESDDISIGHGSVDQSDNNTEILDKNDDITDSCDNDHQSELNCKVSESSVVIDSDEDLTSAEGSSEDNSDNEDDEDNNDENIDEDDEDDDSDGGGGGDDDDDWESMDEDDEISRNLDKIVNSDIDSDSSNDLSERCPICLNRFIGQTIGSPDSCDHSFCLECLIEWTKNVNTCPVDRRLYNQIISRHELGGEIIDKIPVEIPKKDDETDDVTYCEVCGFCDREDRLLLCDHCDKGYHCECLTPPLEHIPIMEWYCPNCSMFEGLENDNGRSEVANRESLSSHAQRAIARTRASESVRLRIQRQRQNSRLNTVRRRRTRKRKYARRKKKTRSTKKQSGKKSKTMKDKSKKTKRKQRKGKKRRRRIKTKKSIAAARPLAAPTIRKRIAEKLGIHKPLPGHMLPQIKKPSSSCFLNAQQYNNGITTVSLFGNRNDLDIINEDFENDGNGGLVALYPRTRDRLISAHNTKIADISNSFRRNISLTPLISRENIDILGNIMQEQTSLYCKSSDIYIGRDGVLNVNMPTDGLEEKQESESSNNQDKVINENPQSSNVSNKNNSYSFGQSSSSVVSSSIDLFDSDNEKFEGTANICSNQSCSKNNQTKPKKKNSGKLFGALNLIELYSDIEDDDNPDSAWGSGKKESKDENYTNEDNPDKKRKMESNENEMNSVEKSDKSSSDRNEKSDSGDKKSSEKIGFSKNNLEKANYLTGRKNETCLNDKINDDIDDGQVEDKKEEQTDEIPDDFADVTPRVNISILPKIPKIKREKLDDKQNEETSNDAGRSSVLSKLDDGSSDTKWNKRSRFNRDKNIVENKSQTEKSYHREDNSRSKSDHYRWSDERNSRDNRNWRERGGDNEHFRDRRHNDRREYDRWERPWRSDQRNDYENSNYMNDHRKKYSRDNRNNNFRERKDDFSRGKSGRSPLREYMYDKERNFGSKSNVNERGNMNRDISNRNYRKKFSYDNLELKRQSPDRQMRNFENKKNQNENFVNKNFDQTCSDNSSALKERSMREPLIKEPPMMREPLIKDPPMMREPLIKDLPVVKEPLIREPPMMREQMNNQNMQEELSNYGSTRNSGLPTKRKNPPTEWDEKQQKLDEDKARERFWENEDSERIHSKMDNNFQNTEENKNTVSDFNLISTSPTTSPHDKESYDPFDPTESPKSTGNKDSKSSTLDIPLPDKSNQELKLVDDKATANIVSFPQTSFDQTSNVNTISTPALPNVHVPPPNYIIHSVPRAPFGNMGVSQPAMQPFNWPTPPPTVLMPPALRGNFIPPPMPPRIMGPHNLQTQMTCLPPSGPMPPVMGPRGPSNTGPMIPNLPPPPLPNLNLPHQIALTNIHHPPPPPPPPPPLLGNANQSSLNNNITHPPPPHPMINAVPIRNQIFVPATTNQLPQEQMLSVNANQIPVPTNLHSPLQSSSTLPVKSSIITTSNLTSSTITENVYTVSQTKPVSSKNNNTVVNRIVSSSSETSLKSLNSDMSNQSSAPRDVTEVVDMDVESPFSPTNSPLDFDDMSLASSGDKSTPSPNAKDDHSNIASPKLKSHSSSKFLSESVKSGTKGKSDKSSNNGKVTSTNKSSKSVVSCGQSLLEEVWAKHILGESPPKSKNAKADTKKRSTEKIRVVRNFSVKKNSLKTEKGPFKMNEDQLKILDEIPSSAVEMQVKEKYLKKLNRQERVVEEVKLALKPYYNRREIDKDEYKDILRKCVPKVCHNRSGSIIPKKIKALVEAYIEKLSHDRKKGKTKPFLNT